MVKDGMTAGCVDNTIAKMLKTLEDVGRIERERLRVLEALSALIPPPPTQESEVPPQSTPSMAS